MLRQSSRRLLLAFLCCCALCLTVGALPAAALSGIDSSASRLEAESWFDRLWRIFGEPAVSLFAADEAQPPAPTPPTDSAGIVIDPDGPRT